VELPDGTQIDYVIDGKNRRVGKKVDGQLQKGWLYKDGLNPVAQVNGDGEITHRFVYAAKANVPAYMVKIDPSTGDETTYRIVSDHRGSVRLVVNVETGDIANASTTRRSVKSPPIPIPASSRLDAPVGCMIAIPSWSAYSGIL
jgi:hypothetical protein